MSNNTITIKYNNKEYEIEKKTEEQKTVLPKGTSTAPEVDIICVRNYNEGLWSHTCECSKDRGATYEKITIKWGTGKHITIWGGGSFGLVLFSWAVYYFGFRGKKEPQLAEKKEEISEDE